MPPLLVCTQLAPNEGKQRFCFRGIGFFRNEAVIKTRYYRTANAGPEEGAMDAKTFMRLLRSTTAGLLIVTAPALADPLAQLDDLSRISTDVAPAIAFARNQIGRGDLLGAIATLERLLINHPESDEALLLHASLLCRVDDPTGSLVELDALRNGNISDRAWSEATAPCGDDDRPGSGG